jgi:hypothetical protein
MAYLVVLPTIMAGSAMAQTGTTTVQVQGEDPQARLALLSPPGVTDSSAIGAPLSIDATQDADNSRQPASAAAEVTPQPSVQRAIGQAAAPTAMPQTEQATELPVAAVPTALPSPEQTDAAMSLDTAQANTTSNPFVAPDVIAGALSAIATIVAAIIGYYAVKKSKS